MLTLLPSKTVFRTLSACSSGLLLALCFPNPSILPLLPVALIPLMAAVDGATPRLALGLGGLFGFVFWIVCHSVDRLHGPPVRRRVLAARRAGARHHRLHLPGSVRADDLRRRARRAEERRGPRPDVGVRLGGAGGLPDLRLDLRRLPVGAPREPAGRRAGPDSERGVGRRPPDLVPRGGAERGALRGADSAPAERPARVARRGPDGGARRRRRRVAPPRRPADGRRAGAPQGRRRPAERRRRRAGGRGEPRRSSPISSPRRGGSRRRIRSTSSSGRKARRRSSGRGTPRYRQAVTALSAELETPILLNTIWSDAPGVRDAPTYNAALLVTKNGAGATALPEAAARSVRRVRPARGAAPVHRPHQPRRARLLHPGGGRDARPGRGASPRRGRLLRGRLPVDSPGARAAAAPTSSSP